jgi:hypothetical protein
MKSDAQPESDRHTEKTQLTKIDSSNASPMQTQSDDELGKLHDKPYPALTNPKYWTGNFPETIKKEEIIYDCGGKLPPCDEAFKKGVQEVFDRKGIVWVKNTGVESL